MSFQTADLCDQYDSELRVLSPIGLRSFGGRPKFHGAISTLKLFEDNSLVRNALETSGSGRVLVVDGGGSMRCALLGDQLGLLGVANGWAGVLVYGCVRDSEALGGMDLGVLALGTHPRKSVKKGVGDRDVPVSFGGLTFTPGEYLYADADGVVLSGRPLI